MSRALLVKSSPGTGKTLAAADSIKRFGVQARILAGSLRLAREMANDHGYALIAGRNESNCERFDVVRALGDGGFEVESLACGTAAEPRCPFRETCPYWAQFQVPGSRVGATEQLFNRNFLAGGSLAVVDDADLSRSLIERFLFPAEQLVAAHKQLVGKKRERTRHLLRVLIQAVLAAQDQEDGWKTVTGAAVWDRLARAAKQTGEELDKVIAALPKTPTLPEQKRGKTSR